MGVRRQLDLRLRAAAAVEVDDLPDVIGGKLAGEAQADGLVAPGAEAREPRAAAGDVEVLIGNDPHGLRQAPLDARCQIARNQRGCHGGSVAAWRVVRTGASPAV